MTAGVGRTIGELRQGAERIRHRGDVAQAKRLERWLRLVTTTYAQAILDFDGEIAHGWGKLRVPNLENPLDQQIAAAALPKALVIEMLTGLVADDSDGMRGVLMEVLSSRGENR